MAVHSEQIGRLADKVDSLIHAAQLPLPAQFHLDQLRAALPEIRETLRLIYIAQTGENPWETDDP